MKKFLLLVWTGMLLLACTTMKKNETIGSIERTDASLDEIISKNAFIEIIGEGYLWSEGPVWVESEKMLLFSDVPRNTIYKWTETGDVEEYLTPSGYTGTEPYGSKEPGSNGLALDHEGNLLLCQHGNRQVAVMKAKVSAAQPEFITLANNFEGKRFNSPNDLTVSSTGVIYFTDPPYGLPQQENDPSRELTFQGVYKIDNGNVSLISDSLSKPNGLAILRDGKTLLVANSDPTDAKWIAFDLTEESANSGRLFFNATSFTSEKGLPDGLKVDDRGNIFATGPGGLWIFNEEAKVLGKVKLPVAAANCALSADQKTLYITASNYLLRLKMRD